MGPIPAALPQNKHWSTGLGAKDGGANFSPKSRNRASSVLREVWGGKKSLFILQNVEDGGRMLCLSQPRTGQAGAVQFRDSPAPLKPAADTGNRGRQATGPWLCLLMSWEGSVLFEDSHHPRVFAYARVCAAAKNLINSSLRVRHRRG